MDGLSAETTKAGRLQRACLNLLREHDADGAIPTSIRFLFYELLDRRVIPKVYRKPDGNERKPTASQEIADAVKVPKGGGIRTLSLNVEENPTLKKLRYA